MTNAPILLVEDNPDDEALTLRALKRTQIKNPILVARDGIEALDYLLGTGNRKAQGPIAPVVMLLDLKMPKMDGLELLERIRSDARLRLLPVVVLTTSDEESDLMRSYELGANSYVRKPVDFGEFSEAVARLGLYWLLLNQRPGALRNPWEHAK